MARLADDDVRERLKSLPGWERHGDAIRRTYPFPDFRAAMAFANRVAGLANAQDHHPDMLVQYRAVTLTLTSHDAGGLTARDFRLAQSIDA
jgi:4a-hydroxytetrahydrobiopterin dehydratase